MKYFFQFILLFLCVSSFSETAFFLGKAHGSKSADVYNLSDTIPPVVYCISGIITVNLDTNSCITIRAKDLDRGSYDDISPMNKLRFYFNGNPLADSIKICCNDFNMARVHDELRLELEFWVADESNNSANQRVTLIVRDNFSKCSKGDPGGWIFVDIRTELGEIIEGVDVSLNLNGQLIAPSISNLYVFQNLNIGEYEVCIAKNDDPLNGVSTADLYKIRKHILGLESLSSDYKLIAADVNQSHSITAADVAEIRRLILGVITEYSRISSWVFIGEDSFGLKRRYKPPSVFSEYCDSVSISSNELIKGRVIGVKMGDVTNNAKLHNVDSQFVARVNTDFIDYQNISIGIDKVHSVFSYSGVKKLAGMQFMINFNSELFEFEKIEAQGIVISPDNFNLFNLDHGALSILWDDLDSEIDGDQFPDLFTIVWRKKGFHNEYPDLKLNSKWILPLLLDRNLMESCFYLRPKQVETICKQFFKASYSSHEITLKTQLGSSEMLRLCLVDISGKLVFEHRALIESGLVTNTIYVTSDLKPGIYFLNVQGVNWNHYSKMFISNF